MSALPGDVAEVEARLVLAAIAERYGYDFRGYAEDSMLRRLEAAAAKVGAAHFGELQHRVLHDPATFAVVLDMLTVRVTEMFRDPELYRTIRDVALPLLRTYPQLKIWHAGCASGEEVYATAILLTEAGIYDRAQLYATDISAAAVQQARDGVYSEACFGGFEANYEALGGSDLARYFSRAYGSVSVLPSLKRNIHVFQHDLVSDFSLGEMQLIFCRNVLIYFGLALRRRVLGLLGGSLAAGGFLCLGASEALPPDEAGKYRQVAPPLRLYQRRSEA